MRSLISSNTLSKNTDRTNILVISFKDKKIRIPSNVFLKASSNNSDYVTETINKSSSTVLQQSTNYGEDYFSFNEEDKQALEFSNTNLNQSIESINCELKILRSKNLSELKSIFNLSFITIKNDAGLYSGLMIRDQILRGSLITESNETPKIDQNLAQNEFNALSRTSNNRQGLSLIRSLISLIHKLYLIHYRSPSQVEYFQMKIDEISGTSNNQAISHYCQNNGQPSQFALSIIAKLVIDLLNFLGRTSTGHVVFNIAKLFNA